MLNMWSKDLIMNKTTKTNIYKVSFKESATAASVKLNKTILAGQQFTLTWTSSVGEITTGLDAVYFLVFTGNNVNDNEEAAVLDQYNKLGNTIPATNTITAIAEKDYSYIIVAGIYPDAEFTIEITF